MQHLFRGRRAPAGAGRAASDATKEASATEERALIETYFDAEFYLARNPDVAEAGFDPLRHFLEHGWREGRDPTAWFSMSEHLEQNPELRPLRINPFYHFLLVRQQEASDIPDEETGSDLSQTTAKSDPSSEAERRVVEQHFDAAYYIACNSDVANSGLDPLDHFLEYGWRERRNPTPWFDIKHYLEHRPDLAQSNVNPFYYYLLERQANTQQDVDRDEATQPNTNSAKNQAILGFQRSVIEPYFDREFYTQTYTDVAASGIDPISHFLSEGWREGRNPNAQFHVEEYLRLNKDVFDAGINPFYHYVITGKAEGRPVKSKFYDEKELISSARSMREKDAEHRRPSSYKAALKDTALRLVLERLLPKHRDRVVVCLSHDDYTANYGGIQNCVGREQQAFNARDIGYVHLSPAHPSLYFRADGRRDELLSLVIDGERCGYAYASDVTNCLSEQLSEAKAKHYLVIHSVLGFSLQFIVGIYSKLDPRRSIFWIHDCSTLCTNYALLRNDTEFCWAPEPDSAACTVCVYGTERMAHLSALARLFSLIKPVVLFPSEIMRDFWHAHSGFATTGSHVVPHATPHFTSEHRSPDVELPVRVGFVGMAAPHKGWHVFRDLAETCRQNARYKFFHFATHPGPKTPAVTFVETAVSSLQPNAMIDAVRDADIDIVVQWSLCFETFSYSTLEAILAGAFLVVRAGSGNAAKLVSEHKAGILLDDKIELMELFSSGKVIEHLRSMRKRSMAIGSLSPNEPSFFIVDEIEEANA